MRQTFRYLVLALPIAAVLLITRPAHAVLEDAILAVVNDHAITMSDVQDYLHSAYTQLRLNGDSPEQIKQFIDQLKKNVLEKLIEERLILDEADSQKIKIRPEAVDGKVNDIEAKYPSQQAFISALTSNGNTITDLRKKIIQQFKIQAVIDQEVKSEIYVDPQAITSYYQKHITEFHYPERANLESIFIPYGKDKDGAVKKLREALAQIKAGSPFKDVAKKYSQSPSIGIVARGQLKPAIEKVVFNLSVGETSGIVETAEGGWIFKLDGKILPSTATLDEARDAIRNRLYEEEFQKAMKKWIAKLKKNAYIQIK